MMVFLIFWLLLIVSMFFIFKLLDIRMWFKYFFVSEFFLCVIYCWFCKLLIFIFLSWVKGWFIDVMMVSLLFIKDWICKLDFFVCFLISFMFILKWWISWVIFFVLLIVIFILILGYCLWSFVKNEGRIYLLIVKLVLIVSIFLIWWWCL